MTEATTNISEQPEKQPWVETIRPRPAWIRRTLRGLIYLIGHSIAKIDVEGREFIPQDGPLIVVANHFSIWEPPMMIYAIPRPLNILAAGDLNWPISQSWALFLYGYIPTNRESFKPSTIRESANVLKQDKVVGIFPEAGMAPNYEMREGKPGAVYLSALTGAKICPVGFSGYEGAGKFWSSLSRPTFTIRIGKTFGPYHLSDDAAEKKRQLAVYGEDVMCRIAALLPERNHGAYAGDPRIQKYQLYEFE